MLFRTASLWLARVAFCDEASETLAVRKSMNHEAIR
jgi:hypothetical protein